MTCKLLKTNGRPEQVRPAYLHRATVGFFNHLRVVNLILKELVV